MTSLPSDGVTAKRILIVEDHPIFRMGLSDLIEQENDLVVCGVAEDVNTAQKAIAELHPDMVILDLALRTSNGLDLLNFIHSEYIHLPVLVLSMHDEQVYAERCLHAGARGYINKKEVSESVIKGIRQILKGNVFLSEEMTASILNKFQNRPGCPGSSPLKILTNRELEVFQLIGKGMVPGAIAQRLHLSAKTVYTHTERIKEKLGIRHTPELVRFSALWAEKENP